MNECFFVCFHRKWTTMFCLLCECNIISCLSIKRSFEIQTSKTFIFFVINNQASIVTTYTCTVCVRFQLKWMNVYSVSGLPHILPYPHVRCGSLLGQHQNSVCFHVIQVLFRLPPSHPSSNAHSHHQVSLKSLFDNEKILSFKFLK